MGPVYALPGTVHSKDQVVLLKKRFEASSITIERVGERILIVNFMHRDKECVVAIVYGPNVDHEKEGCIEMSKYSENHNVIATGDYNIVLHNQLDVIAGKPHDARIVK